MHSIDSVWEVSKRVYGNILLMFFPCPFISGHVPFFLILCLRSRDNLEPWPLMAFLLSPEEIVYYHYQLQQD